MRRDPIATVPVTPRRGAFGHDAAGTRFDVIVVERFATEAVDRGVRSATAP